MEYPTAQPNNPALAGRDASAPMLLGPHNRFCLYAVHTRFDAVQWFVADAETLDPVTKAPAIVRQEDSPELAVSTLDLVDHCCADLAEHRAQVARETREDFAQAEA